MEPEALRALADKLEGSGELDLELRSALAQAECAAFPGLRAAETREPVEEALRLVAKALPGWRVTFEGSATPDVLWTCTLREYGTRDDDEVIGIGKASSLALALHAALLKVAAARAEGYS